MKLKYESFQRIYQHNINLSGQNQVFMKHYLGYIHVNYLKSDR